MSALFFALLSGIHAASAQRIAPKAGLDRWTLDAQYVHFNAGAIARRATPSLGITLGRDLGRTEHVPSWRAEAGWLRVVRASTTAQGGTAGLSAAFGAGSFPRWNATLARLTIRPAISLLAGWAEVQDSSALYDWRGLPSTPYAGTSGTQFSWSTRRGRTLGAGLSLGAEFRLTHAIGISGSVRKWAFTGDVVAPNRHVTLLGLGVTARPSVLVTDTARWLREFGR